MVATGARHRVCLFLLMLLGMTPTVWAQGRIEGVVKEQETGAPLSGVNIRVMGTQRGAASDADGRFVIANLPAGTYTLEPLMIGFESRLTSVEVVEDTVVTVEILLAETVTALREVVVTPGRFAVMQAQPLTTQTFSRDDIQGMPQIGEDIYRAVRRLPGLAGNDFSSQLHVRGGLEDEVLVELDGMELYEPFHLKDIGSGAISVLDAEAVGGIDMMTGAFPVEYGNRLSGVFSLASATPVEGRVRTSVGLSFMNLRFLSEGRFAGDKGEWLVLARRGYLDIVLDLTGGDDNFSPTYYDVLGKTRYRLSDRHSLALYVLHSGDDLDFTDEDDDTFKAQTGYGNSYSWLTWNAVWSARLHARTIASVGRISADRRGSDISDEDRELLYAVDDDRSFVFAGIKQDWTFELGERHLLKGGFGVKQLGASYAYANRVRTRAEVVDDQLILDFDSTQVNTKPEGREAQVYLGHRMRIARPLTVEWGARYDHSSWTGDDLISPRVNLAYALGRRTTLRAGWGRFYQTQSLHHLDVQDGVATFYAAEASEHRMMGLAHALTPNIHLRLDVYQKKLSDLHPRFVNFEETSTEFFPEAFGNRIRLDPERGEASGIEVFIRKDNGRTLNWLASYSFAHVEEKIDGRDVPRGFDQRHTVFVDLAYRPSPAWRFSLAWQYHSGWPYTEITFERIDGEDGTVAVRGQYGAYNGARLPAYHRLDLRVRRYFEFSRSRLSVFAEVSNVYDRSNVRQYDYDVSAPPSGGLTVRRTAEDWLPLLPSLGVSWDLFR